MKRVMLVVIAVVLAIFAGCKNECDCPDCPDLVVNPSLDSTYAPIVTISSPKSGDTVLQGDIETEIRFPRALPATRVYWVEHGFGVRVGMIYNPRDSGNVSLTAPVYASERWYHAMVITVDDDTLNSGQITLTVITP